MDPNLWTSLPQAGVAGVLVLVITYVLRSNHADRQQYAQLRTTTEAVHERDLSELRTQVAELRAEVRELRRELEEARHARYKAEDEAARYRRMAGVTDND